MQWRISKEEQKALRERQSKKAKERWADPVMRAKLSAAQSEGTKAAWSDPEKAAARLRKREARAKELGFDSYGQLAAYTNTHRSAEKCGVTFEVYTQLTPRERKELRRKNGLGRKRG